MANRPLNQQQQSALLRALGIDPKRCTKAVITFEAGRAATVELTRYQRGVDLESVTTIGVLSVTENPDSDHANHAG